VALRTPPAGVPRYDREPDSRESLSSMETIKEMPAPITDAKDKSS
jgi:hypothetical protein